MNGRASGVRTALPEATRGRVRWTALMVAAIGAALVAGAVAANQHWLDQHFVPSFFLPRHWYVRIETAVRVFVAAGGVLLMAARWRLGGALVRSWRIALYASAAAILALGAGELVLRGVQLRPTEWLVIQEEPLRIPDARLGWRLAPSRTGHVVVGGRPIDYAIDAAGDRVRRVDEPVDPARPTLLFVGESVMFGEGLTWDESIPAQVGSMLGLQIANLAVHGYSTDQAYLRLLQELPRFLRPVAVVSLFMTDLFGRNLDHDRPHLAPGLLWVPPVQRSHIESLARLLVPYRATDAVERGALVTREVLHATAQLAAARGAVPVILVPRFGPEDSTQHALRTRVVDDTVPSLVVTVDAAWRLPWDRHPNAYAAHVIATAIAERLRQRLGRSH